MIDNMGHEPDLNEVDRRSAEFLGPGGGLMVWAVPHPLGGWRVQQAIALPGATPAGILDALASLLRGFDVMTDGIAQEGGIPPVMLRMAVASRASRLEHGNGAMRQTVVRDPEPLTEDEVARAQAAGWGGGPGKMGAHCNGPTYCGLCIAAARTCIKVLGGEAGGTNVG